MLSDSHTREEIRSSLIAALTALREPTQAMLDGGVGVVDPYGHPTWSEYEARQVWVAMIDSLVGGV